MEVRKVDCDRTPIWQRLLADEAPHARLEQAVQELLSPDSGAAAVVAEPWCHVVDRRAPLMFSALLRRPDQPGPLEVRSLHPYTESGYLWPMQLQLVEESSDGGTATVMGKVGPAAMGIFDTMYFRRRYEDDVTYDFQVSGIALALARETLPEQYSADFCGYGCLRLTTGPEAPGDVIELHSVVQATQPVTFRGAALTRYLVTIAKLPDGDLTFDVYGNDEVVGRYEVGDRIAGHVWIFGFSPP